jgi:hypothetical protein
MTEKERFLHLVEPEGWEAFVLKGILENPTRYPPKKFPPKKPPRAKALPPQKPSRPGRRQESGGGLTAAQHVRSGPTPLGS